jgi:hypothetical protein
MALSLSISDFVSALRLQALSLLAACSAPLTAALVAPAPVAAAEEPRRISAPVVHENLAVYFIHGRSLPGPVPLTLREALVAGKVVVHETGDVNRLAIENTGGEEVFVQAGDIVKGGQQDRVLTISMLVPARSGRLDIGAYCVEQGRWSARGKEDVKRFTSAENAIPSRDAKLAMLAPARPRAAPMAASSNREAHLSNGLHVEGGHPADSQRTQQRTVGGNERGTSRQSQVWSSVAEAQHRLSESIGAPVAAAESASSLQLTLENARLTERRRSFIDALRDKARGEDIVGYVFAVGGRLNSGDVYASNALFRKMWSKQLEAAVTEAIAGKDPTPATPPGADEVRDFLTAAEAGAPEVTTLAVMAQVRETRDSDKALLAETRGGAGAVVHRAYVAR